MSEHRNLTGASLHEPKGAAGASSKEVYVANGAGSGSWQRLAMGGVQYINTVGTPPGTVITGSGAADIKVSDILTTASQTSMPHGFTANADGSLTYTGSVARHTHIACTFSLVRSSGASVEGRGVLYKYTANTSSWSVIEHSEIRIMAAATPTSTAIHADVMLNTGDKLVLALQNVDGAADLNLVTYYLFAMAVFG